MNELEKREFLIYTFSPKPDRRLGGGDRKTTGKPSVIQTILTNK